MPSLRVWLNISVSPIVCGWYAVVILYSMTVLSSSISQTALQNYLPWSEIKTKDSMPHEQFIEKFCSMDFFFWWNCFGLRPLAEAVHNDNSIPGTAK